MKEIKYGKMELLHAYQKHNLKKSNLVESYSKGVLDSFLEKKSNNILIFCKDYTIIIVNQKYELVTAWKSTPNQYKTMCRKNK